MEVLLFSQSNSLLVCILTPYGSLTEASNRAWLSLVTLQLMPEGIKAHGIFLSVQ